MTRLQLAVALLGNGSNINENVTIIIPGQSPVQNFEIQEMDEKKSICLVCPKVHKEHASNQHPKNQERSERNAPKESVKASDPVYSQDSSPNGYQATPGWNLPHREENTGYPTYHQPGSQPTSQPVNTYQNMDMGVYPGATQTTAPQMPSPMDDYMQDGDRGGGNKWVQNMVQRPQQPMPQRQTAPQKKYYELTFSPDVSIVILGTRQPTFREAKEFCAEFMKANGFAYIDNIREISSEQAHAEYELEDENQLPVFAG